MEEIWMPVIGYEGLYQVSNMGNVRSLDREITDRSGCVRILKGRVRKQVMTRGGYLMVGLCKECKGKWFKVHRLVWMAFNGIIPDGMQINHIDEDKSNNNVNNLNSMDCVSNINWGTGIERRASQARKPVIQMSKDGKEIQRFNSVTEAANALGLHHVSISKCCLNRPHCISTGGYMWKYV